MFFALPLITWHQIYLGPITIQVWGLMVSLGFLVAIVIAAREARKRGLDDKKIYDLALWIIVASFVGARLLFLLEAPAYFVAHPADIFKIWQGGMSITGGFIGALVATVIYTRRKAISFWAYGESIVFALPAGICLGRLGCSLIHDHPGRETDAPWGVDFNGTTRHEPAYYLVLNALLMFLFFLIMKRRSIARKEGFFISSFMIWEGFTRFWLDFTRDPTVDERLLGLTFAQYFSIFLFFGGIYIAYKKLWKKYSPAKK